MTTKSGWYPPIPIVGVGDSVAGEFSVRQAAATVAKGSITLQFSGLEVSNTTIASLLEQRRAAAVVKICCDATYFRSTEGVAVPDGVVVLSSVQVIDEIVAALRIVSLERLSQYRPEGLNGDYGDAHFAVETGDILAEGPEFRFSIDAAFDPLKAPVSSIMRVRRVEDHFEGYRINFDSNRIVIEFSDSEWRRYQRLKSGTVPAVLHASVVLPVLTEAVSIVKAHEPTQEGELWHRRLRAMVEACGELTTTRPAAEIAQQLLKGPFARAAAQLLNDDGEA